MSNTVVIYESKYGFTRRYAEWIAEALSCEIFERKYFHPEDFRRYDTVIYGGGLYAGKVNGIKLLTQNFSLLNGKNIILFTCGLMDPHDQFNVDHIRKSLTQTLSPDIMDALHIFHLRGGIDYSGLSLTHKAMMHMLRKMLSGKAPQDLREEDKVLLDTYGKSIDFTEQEMLQPLIDFTLSSHL